MSHPDTPHPGTPPDDGADPKDPERTPGHGAADGTDFPDSLGISPTSRLAAQLGDRLLALADRAWRIVGQAERTRQEASPRVIQALMPYFETLLKLDNALRVLGEEVGVNGSDET